MMKRPHKSKSQTIKQLTDDIKELLQLDECEPILEPGLLWLRMKSGGVAFDCPVGLKPLFDKKHNNLPAIKKAVISVWIAHLEKLQAGAVLDA
jgi:hypothetical protein